MRIFRWLILLATGAAAPTSAQADEFGGWRYRTPAGWTADAGGDHIGFQNVTGARFCKIGLYESRAAAQSIEREAAFEWVNVVEKTFQASDIEVLGKEQTRGAIPYLATAATVTAADRPYYAILYVVTPPGLVSSVIALSNTAETMTHCKTEVSDFLDSLSAVKSAAASAPTPAARPPASASPLVGRWAKSASASGFQGFSLGSIKQQYVFGADGRYSYRMEGWGGHARSDQWHIVEERGTYTVSGDQLTLKPSSATRTVRGEQQVRATEPVALETTTYRWSTHYFEGIQENNLVLTPPTRTNRDGEFASNEQFAASYLYSAQYQPEWKFPPR